MPDRSRLTRSAAQILVPIAVIIVANFAGMQWLSLAATLALGWFVGSALLREPENLPPLRSLWFGFAAIIITGVAMLALVIVWPPSYILIPGLLIGVTALYCALGSVIWWLIRLNNASPSA
jgi:hypothetical protein